MSEEKDVNKIEEDRKEYIEAFNTNVVEMLSAILTEGKKNNNIENIKLFHLNMDNYKADHENPMLSIDRIDIGDDQLEDGFKTLEDLAKEDPELGYYWTTFKKDKNEYRICMFYRGLDRGTGNIHVFPGPIQVWQKEKEYNEERHYIADNRSYNMSNEENKEEPYTKHGGSKPYYERWWTPLVGVKTPAQNIPMLWNIKYKDEISKNLWNNDLDVGELEIDTLKVINGIPLSVQCFYSMYCVNEKFREWYDLLYPEPKVGNAIASAFHFLNFKTPTKKEKEMPDNCYFKSGYRNIYVEGEGFFNIVDGKEHKISYKNKKTEDGKRKNDKFYWSGPNYITDVGWKFEYLSVEAPVKII